MHRAIRSQSDDLFGFYSEVTAIDTADWKDMTRQEYKHDADINTILRNFNVLPPMRPIQFGEVDYRIDLQTALDAVKQAKRAHARLPEDVREDYPTWQSLLNGIEAGELDFKEGDPPTPPTPPAAPA